MTMQSKVSKAVFSGNGATTDFPFDFKVWDSSELSVTIAGPDGASIPATGWTATFTETGGTVTYLKDGAPLPSGWKLAILRNMPFTQPVDLLSGTRFDPQVIEDSMDMACAERQQLLERLERTITVPPTDSRDPDELLAEFFTMYSDVLEESQLIKTALGNFFCASITPFTTQAGVQEYEVSSEIPLDPILNNLFLVLDGVAQEPKTSFVIVDSSHIRFTSDPGDSLRCWGVTSLSMSSPDIRLVVEAAIQKIVAEGDNQADRAKEFADAAAQSASEAAEDAKDVAADKEHVDTVAGQIQGLQIVVNTLNPGEQATASYDPVTGVLTLGVPKGDSGDAAIATPTSLGSVIPQTGDEDGLELEKDGKLRVRKASDTQRGSVLASVTAAANAVPQAGEDGALDESWTENCLKLSGGTLTGAVAESLAKVTGEAVTLDLKAANNFTHNVTANTAFTVTANTGNSFQLGTLVLTNGGAFTVTWPSSFKWADGAPPSLMESGIDVITFFTINGGTTYYAAQAMTGIA